MTSAQSMQPVRLWRAGLRSIVIAAALGLPTVLAGCNGQLAEPATVQAPYPRLQAWGVAPFLNESGVSIVDTPRIADGFVAEVQQIAGIDTIPVNRVIAAMRETGIPEVVTHGDALTIMNLLQLDGLVVGTITAYDPYRPLRFGMAVQLYTRQPLETEVNPRDLTASTSGTASPGEIGPPRPVAQAAGVFDAKDHRTLRRLEEYAAGRHEPRSAFGPEIYLVSMDLYTGFVCHQLLQDLLRSEEYRMALAAQNQD